MSDPNLFGFSLLQPPIQQQQQRIGTQNLPQQPHQPPSVLHPSVVQGQPIALPGGPPLGTPVVMLPPQPDGPIFAQGPTGWVQVLPSRRPSGSSPLGQPQQPQQQHQQQQSHTLPPGYSIPPPSASPTPPTSPSAGSRAPQVVTISRSFLGQSPPALSNLPPPPSAMCVPNLSPDCLSIPTDERRIGTPSSALSSSLIVAPEALQATSDFQLDQNQGVGLRSPLETPPQMGRGLPVPNRGRASIDSFNLSGSGPPAGFEPQPHPGAGGGGGGGGVQSPGFGGHRSSVSPTASSSSQSAARMPPFFFGGMNRPVSGRGAGVTTPPHQFAQDAIIPTPTHQQSEMRESPHSGSSRSPTTSMPKPKEGMNYPGGGGGGAPKSLPLPSLRTADFNDPMVAQRYVPMHSGLKGKVPFVPFDFLPEKPPSPGVHPTAKSDMTRIFIGQLSYTIDASVVSKIAYAVTGYQIFGVELITKRATPKGPCVQPTGCVHAYCRPQEAEKLLFSLHRQAMVDTCGVWIPSTEEQRNTLLAYCQHIQLDRSTRFPGTPCCSIVAQVATTDWKPKHRGRKGSKQLAKSENPSSMMELEEDSLQDTQTGAEDFFPNVAIR